MCERIGLLRLLADGQWHSGRQLADTLGLSRGRLGRRTRDLAALGVHIEGVRAKGYRWTAPVEFLSARAIRAELGARSRALLGRLEILSEVDSTNRHLMTGANHGAPHGAACFAECQLAGRGRRGRTWVSPFGNIYLSVLWRFAAPCAQRGLSLAVGAMLAEALVTLGVEGVGLKWPNDLYWRGQKLGGVLFEGRTARAAEHLAVAGIGINYCLPDGARSAIGQASVDLLTAAGAPIERNRAAGAVLDAVLRGLDRFRAEGLAPFRDAWQRLDITRNRRVTVEQGTHVTQGLSRGIDEEGALLLVVGGATHRIQSGDLSLRVLP